MKTTGAYFPWNRYNENIPYVRICSVCSKDFKKFKIKDMQQFYRSKIEFHLDQINELKEMIG